MNFNPKEHLSKIKGKDYLEVKWRLVWFREDHPDYEIDTEFIVLDIDQGVAVCRAVIKDNESRQLACGTKTEYKASFFDYVEKSETGAIGRALATLGYGTQFAPELEEGDRIVDSPTDMNNSNQKQKSQRKLTKREKKIRNIIGDDQDLRKMMVDFLSNSKAKSLNDLNVDAFKSLKQTLLNAKEAKNDDSEEIANNAAENIN
jgi:hypothetical protein